MSWSLHRSIWLTQTNKHAFQYQSCGNANFLKKCVNVLTPGAACDTSTSLPKAGALQHHPALVRLLPGLPHHVRRRCVVVVATLSCDGRRRIIQFIILCNGALPVFPERGEKNLNLNQSHAGLLPNICCSLEHSQGAEKDLRF